MESEEHPPLVEAHDEILNKSAFELCEMYFDDDIEELFVRYSNLYARQKNDHEFSLTKHDLFDFMTIMTISSYNMRPRFSIYWSFDEDIRLPLVRSLMSRNKCRKTKTYLHCCDKTNLDETDKWAKLRPLIEAVNEKLQEFGIFSSELSIDEQMIPCFGQHSCKMFVRGKAFLSFLL